MKNRLDVADQCRLYFFLLLFKFFLFHKKTIFYCAAAVFTKVSGQWRCPPASLAPGSGWGWVGWGENPMSWHQDNPGSRHLSCHGIRTTQCHGIRNHFVLTSGQPLCHGIRTTLGHGTRTTHCHGIRTTQYHGIRTTTVSWNQDNHRVTASGQPSVTASGQPSVTASGQPLCKYTTSADIQKNAL